MKEKKLKTEQELKDWIIMMHKQNLSGREDFVEAFEFGIDAALEELKDLKMISLNDAIIKDIGAIGTPERDEFEKEIEAELSCLSLYELETEKIVEQLRFSSTTLEGVAVLKNYIEGLLRCPECNSEYIHYTEHEYWECSSCDYNWIKPRS